MPALHQRSPLNSNQKALLAVGVLFWLLAAAIFMAVITSPEGGLSNAVGGAACPAIFASLFFFIVSRGRRPRHQRAMAGLVRSQSHSGGAYRDIEVSSEQKLPKICIRCGVPTRRTSPFRFKGAHTDANPYDWSRLNPLTFILAMYFFFRILILARIWQSIEKRLLRRKGTSDRVEFKIPHCRSCAQSSPVVQRHFDFHGRKMILEAHPAFREALKKAV